MLTMTALGCVMLLSGCPSASNSNATLDALRKPMAAHADALAQDGGPLSVSTGRDVIAIYEAGINAH